MTITKTLLIIYYALFMIACSNTNHEMDNKAIFTDFGSSDKAMDPSMRASPTASEKDLLPEPNAIEQKLIKNGKVNFETKSIKDTKSFLQKIILKHKGYISNEKVHDYSVNPTEIITVRIRNSDFDNLIYEIGEQVGEFDSKKIDIDDVTAEFVDIEARLKNKKQLESKYQELLAKANNIPDILKI